MTPADRKFSFVSAPFANTKRQNKETKGYPKATQWAWNATNNPKVKDHGSQFYTATLWIIWVQIASILLLKTAHLMTVGVDHVVYFTVLLTHSLSSLLYLFHFESLIQLLFHCLVTSERSVDWFASQLVFDFSNCVMVSGYYAELTRALHEVKSDLLDRRVQSTKLRMKHPYLDKFHITSAKPSASFALCSSISASVQRKSRARDQWLSALKLRPVRLLSENIVYSPSVVLKAEQHQYEANETSDDCHSSIKIRSTSDDSSEMKFLFPVELAELLRWIEG